ncbi:hypothetical protein QJS66_21335 [Kocuria rhizophila]|nr:hypothetical protein QJS66_21335 [Kocuria rhizophila]
MMSALSLLIAGVGTYQANKRANEALAESRKAAEDARWFAVQEAVQRLIGFDPTAEPVGGGSPTCASRRSRSSTSWTAGMVSTRTAGGRAHAGRDHRPPGDGGRQAPATPFSGG